MKNFKVGEKFTSVGPGWQRSQGDRCDLRSGPFKKLTRGFLKFSNSLQVGEICKLEVNDSICICASAAQC